MSTTAKCESGRRETSSAPCSWRSVDPASGCTSTDGERGWVAVWEVINGQPREQRANFIDTDDFGATGERIALISGKHGSKKAMFAPGDESLLPPVYRRMQIEVQRDRCAGPYAKNRLGVIAADNEVEVMLEHALAHLRLRS